MSAPIPCRTIATGDLLQHVSRIKYRADPLCFGSDGANRYDAADKSYGVLYLASDLATALMESVFHKHRWHRQTKRTIALAEVKSRMVRAVGVMRDLILADLTAPGVMSQHFGLNLSQLSSRRYKHTQKVSATVHAMVDKDAKPCFDGVLYPSRNNYPAECVALFDRAGHKVQVIDDIDLVDHADWPGFVSAFNVGIVARSRAGRRPSARGP